MTASVLLTGFGPFPGAPFNPTGPLVAALAHRPNPALANVRRVAHVFDVSYVAVDRELPMLLARERPDVLLMFGLALRTRHIRIETLARNALARTLPDAAGELAADDAIASRAPAALALRVPALRLLTAARAAGMPAVLSRDAGRYLCNYLCWRAAEGCGRAETPHVVAFVHVPGTRPGLPSGPLPRRPPFTHDDLVQAGEAILLAALAAARLRRRPLR
jgi:pyroglutamyl-peptidase